MREATLYSLLSQLAGGQVYPYVVPLTEGKPRGISAVAGVFCGV